MKIVIIGGGIQGLACAYALAKQGILSVTILEAKRIGYGESSRNSGGIRAQFRNEPNIRLAQRSKLLYEKMTSELNYHILLNHGGYLYLHYKDDTAMQAEQEVKLHNRLGVPTRLISPQEVARVVPGINVDGILVGQYNPRDASCHHDAVLWAFLKILQKMGVTIRNNVKVTGLDKQNNRIAGVWLSDDFIAADQVIVAAGAWTRQILNTIEIDVPTNSWRREQIVAESYRHFIKPYLIDKKRGISFHQTVRGEIIGSAHVPINEPSMNWEATRPSIEKVARGIYELFPGMGQISLMRQWAGSRDFTPDGTPIFGPLPDVQGLWIICGQSGAGWMLAPAIAESIAREMVGMEPGVDWKIYSPMRFIEGRELWERAPTG